MARTGASTVRYWRMIGKGPKGVKRGRRVLYPESVVERWLTGDDETSRPGRGLTMGAFAAFPAGAASRASAWAISL
jgi:hypothetical protein